TGPRWSAARWPASRRCARTRSTPAGGPASTAGSGVARCEPVGDLPGFAGAEDGRVGHVVVGLREVPLQIGGEDVGRVRRTALLAVARVGPQGAVRRGVRR